MFCGNISNGKGVHILVDAVKILFDRGVEVYLDIYGSAAMSSCDCDYEIKTKRNALGLRVVFHGAVGKERLYLEYSKHSLLVLPTELESFGLVLAEAQACGCIPVVHDCGGIDAAVIKGYKYKNNTPENLADTIQGAMLTVKQSMRDYVMSESKIRFDNKKTFDAVESIIKEVVA